MKNEIVQESNNLTLYFESFKDDKEDQSIAKVKEEMGSFLKDIGLLEQDDFIPIHKRWKYEETDDEFKTVLTALVSIEKLVANEHTF